MSQIAATSKYEVFEKQEHVQQHQQPPQCDCRFVCRLPCSGSADLGQEGQGCVQCSVQEEGAVQGPHSRRWCQRRDVRGWTWELVDQCELRVRRSHGCDRCIRVHCATDHHRILITAETAQLGPHSRDALHRVLQPRRRRASPPLPRLPHDLRRQSAPRPTKAANPTKSNAHKCCSGGRAPLIPNTGECARFLAEEQPRIKPAATGTAFRRDPLAVHLRAAGAAPAAAAQWPRWGQEPR